MNFAQIKPTVTQFCDATRLPQWRVRRAIKDGALIVNKEYPMKIVEGEMPLSVSEWKQELAPFLSNLSTACYGFEGGELHIVTKDCNVEVFKHQDTREGVLRQSRSIERLNVARKQIAAE